MTFTLQVRELVEGGEKDDFGNIIDSWKHRDWDVRSIAPGASEEPEGSNRDLSVVLWTVYADKGGEPTKDDQVRLPGSDEWLTVEGRPLDWTLGPPQVGPVTAHHTPPGVVVELRRADG